MQESFEVEIKVPISDPQEMKKKLLGSGASQLNSEVQIDTYFDHPCRSFEETDEAIRVRTRRPLDDSDLDPSHTQNELTYKGPRIDKKTKTRLEYSVAVGDVNEITSIIELLGFKPVATIKKKRAFYNLRDITISIDDVENVGHYLELELIAHGKRTMELAKKTLFDLLEELDINPDETVRDSYLWLYLEQKKH